MSTHLFTAPTFLFSWWHVKEVDDYARQVIHDHHNWINSWSDRVRPQPCSFGDMVDQLSCGIFWPPTWTFLEKHNTLQQVPLQPAQFCHAHGTWCSCLQEVDVDMSGLPCQHNRRANNCRLFQDGPHTEVYIVWAKKHRYQRTKLMVLENTEEAFCNYCIYMHIIHVY